MTEPGDVTLWLEELREEYERSMREPCNFPLFNSSHEGCSVIREEFEELWDCVKTNEPPYAVRHEAIQVGAMALKFLLSMDQWNE